MCRLTDSELPLCVDGIMNGGNYHQCRLHHYNMKDVIYCLTNNRHIAFIGDSRIRQQFLSFIKVLFIFSFSFTIYLHLKQLIPDCDRQPNEELEDQLFHKDVNITSRLLNDLIISFRWRPEINQHLIKDLLNWISQSSQTAPDFILIGYFIKFKIRLLKC